MKEHSELNDIVENLTQELKRGTLVLGVLLCTTDEVYGYALVTSLQERGIHIEQNTLYPLLRRLEKQGLLESSWQTDESRPRVITGSAKQAVRYGTGSWLPGRRWT